MINYKNEVAGLYISDAPDDFSPQGQKEILLALRSLGEPFTGTHQEALALAMPVIIAGSITRVPASIEPAGPLSMADQLIQDAAGAPAPALSIADTLIDKANAPPPPEPPKTDARGLVGAATRGLAPVTAGAIAGAAVAGLPGAAFGAISVPIADLVITGINAVFGTDWRTPSEAIRGALESLGVADVPETDMEMAVQVIFQTLGMAGTVSNVANIAATAPGVVQGTGLSRIVGGASVPVTTGRMIAEKMAYGPGGQLVGAVTGGTAQEGTSRGLVALGVKPEIANAAGTVVGMIVDAATSGVIDRFQLRQRARGMDVPQRAQDMTDITEQMAPGRPLQTDEMLLGSDPTQKEFTDISTRMRSAGAGTTDAFQARVHDTQDSIVRWSTEQGVETTSLGGIQDRSPELLTIHNETRGGNLRRYAEQKYEVIDSLSEPVGPPVEGVAPSGKPVNTSNTRDVILAVQRDLADLDAQAFQGIGRQLDNWSQNLENMDLARVNRTLAIVRDAISDETVPAGIAKEVQRAYTKVAAALKDDLNGFILREGGEEVLGRFNEANNKLQLLLEDFNDRGVADIINEAARRPSRQTLGSIQNMHKSNMDPVEYRAFFEQLDSQGQDLSWSALVGNILEEAGLDNPSVRTWDAAVTKYDPLIRVATEGRPEALEYLEDMHKFITDVAGQAERVVKEGLTSGRMGLGENPTAGIALSQGVRRFGIAAGLLFGDILQGSYGAVARAYQRPKIRNMVASLRTLTPGTTAWERIARNLIRDIYIDELQAEEASEREERREAATRHIESSPRIQELFEQSPAPTILPPPIPREE